MPKPTPSSTAPRKLTFETIPAAIIDLELETAHLENTLFTLHEALTALDEFNETTITTTIKEHAVAILKGLEGAENTNHELCVRLVEIGFKLDEFPDGVEAVLRRQFMITDRSLVAADRMREGLMDWADKIYLEAYEREKLVRGSKTSEGMVPLTEEEEEA